MPFLFSFIIWGVYTPSFSAIRHALSAPMRESSSIKMAAMCGWHILREDKRDDGLERFVKIQFEEMRENKERRAGRQETD